jgi:hypothetical protein
MKNMKVVKSHEEKLKPFFIIFMPLQVLHVLLLGDAGTCYADLKNALPI